MFEHLHLKFAKSADMTINFFFLHKNLPKNAEFYTDSKFVEIGSKKVHEKSSGKKLSEF